MEQETYGKEVADCIRELTEWPDALDIREDGVYVNKDYLAIDLNEQAFTWTPACDMDWAGAPDPLNAPALPIPFTSRNLAAFMLDAAGRGLQIRFGRIKDGLDEGQLERFSIRATKVCQVLRDAYKLAQDAQCVVGADNLDEQQRAADLLSEYDDVRLAAIAREKVMERLKVRTGKDGKLEYGDFDIPSEEYLKRLARVNKDVDSLEKKAQEAFAESERGHRKWRKAMVRELLHPSPKLAKQNARPLKFGEAQDSAILSAIRERGFDPSKLPKNEAGKPGVAAAVRGALVGVNPLFPINGTQFKHAWERLRARKEIADQD